MKKVTKSRLGRIAVLVALGAMVVAGGAFAAEVTIGKSLDPVQGVLFTTNNSSIVNSAWSSSSASFVTRASRVGPEIHRFYLNDVGQLNAENTWQQYE